MEKVVKEFENQEAAIKDFLLWLSAFDGVNETVESLLEKLVHHYGADRACVFEQSEGGSRTTSTFEWRNESIRHLGDAPDEISVGFFEDWHKRFQKEVSIFVKVDECLRENDAQAYDILSVQGIETLIVTPLLSKGKISGILSVENPRKNLNHLLLLAVVAGAIYKELQFARGLQKEEQLKKHLEDDIAAISGLASEYEFLFIVNLETATFDAYVGGQMILDDPLKAKGPKPSFYEGFANAMRLACHPDDLDRMMKFSKREYIEECLKDKKKFTTRFRCIPPTGGIIWTDLIMIKYDAVDQLPTRLSIGYVNATAEVSAEEARQNELQEALKRSEAANEAKTVFLNNMSHDIRTPMNAILGFAKLMEKETSNPEIISDYLGKIVQSGEYLLSIINNILDIARIDSGKVELEEGFMDIFGASNSFDAMIENELQKKKLKMIPSANITHRYIYADSVKLRQIMVNLISNAVKYTKDNGSIFIDISEYPCEKEGYGTFVTTVRDTGIGMSKEFLQRIFESFTREKNTTDSKIVGTGLGMAIVKKIVDLMGGKIEVESELGKGSTFRVTNMHRIVENPKEYLQDKQGVHDEGLNLAGKHVLLAEDNELNAEITMAILDDNEILVDHAQDGIICIDMLNKAAPGYYDMVLMDVQMPNMDGYRATQVIRELEDKEKSRIPIVAMTANAFEEDRQKAADVGMNGHVAKPVDVDKLLEAMREVLK